jgi:hypothetical protein
VSIAVLEHTRYPWIVAKEFYRVLRSGSYGVIAVPFLQPQHACPHDYVRFTEQGLVELMKYVGFEVIETGRVHHFGQTIAWQLWEYLQANTQKWKLPLWAIVINQMSKGNLFKGDSDNTHNTHYVIVKKPGERSEIDAASNLELLNNSDISTWFYPMLACPQSHQALQLTDDRLVSQDGQFSYPIEENIPNLLPTTIS